MTASSDTPPAPPSAGARRARASDVPRADPLIIQLVARRTVIFGGEGQTLRISHDWIDHVMPGVLLAVRQGGGLQSLRSIAAGARRQGARLAAAPPVGLKPETSWCSCLELVHGVCPKAHASSSLVLVHRHFTGRKYTSPENATNPA